MAITGAVAAAVRKFDPFPEFSEVRAFRGRRETGGRQFYKSGGLIVPRYEMLPGVLVQGGAGFGQREVNAAWRGARDGEPLIGDGGLRGAEARTNSIRNPVMPGAVVGVVGAGGALPTNWGTAGNASGLLLTVVEVGRSSGLDYIDLRISGTPSASSVFGVQCEGPLSGPVASAGQTWTTRSFLALVGGSATNIGSVVERVRTFNGAGVALEASAGVDRKASLTASLAPFSESLTATDGATARVSNQLLVFYTSGQPIDLTLRIAAPNLKLGADINDPPILQTSGLAATRTAMAYRETGRNIAPVHYGVARARWLAPIANHAANFPHLMEFRASAGPARVLWYASLAGNGARFTAGSTGGAEDPVIALGTPTVGQWVTVAWALRGAELAVSQNGGAISSAAMSAPPTLTQVSFLNGATGLNNVANAELDFSATVNGEITNDNLQALSARFAA